MTESLEHLKQTNMSSCCSLGKWACLSYLAVQWCKCRSLNDSSVSVRVKLAGTKHVHMKCSTASQHKRHKWLFQSLSKQDQSSVRKACPKALKFAQAASLELRNNSCYHWWPATYNLYMELYQAVH